MALVPTMASAPFFRKTLRVMDITLLKLASCSYKQKYRHPELRQ
jgi:hypothetical protein